MASCLRHVRAAAAEPGIRIAPGSLVGTKHLPLD